MDETNRRAIMIYLRNLTILETIKRLTSSRLYDMLRLRDRIENSKLKTFTPVKKTTSAFRTFISNGAILWTVLILIAWLISLVLDFIGFVALVVTVGIFIYILCISIKEARQNVIDNQQSIIESEQKNREAVAKYNEDKKRLGGIISVIGMLNEEIKEITALLKNEYDVNLIPKKYRNIEGVYYLYEYMSTSTQDLRDALLHADLNAIEEKLDTMIAQHEKTLNILQKGIKNIVRQNTMLLQQAQAVASSAQQVEMYQRIIADNSRLSLIMQREQLAYQRADFYLK